MDHRRLKPLPPLRTFITRVVRGFTIGLIAILGALAMGALGYHHFEHLTWLDSFLNAAMILTGMGPIHIPETTGGKLFAIFYALFSGLVFLTAAGFLIAPFARRTIHDLHLKIHVPDAPDDRPAKPPLP